MADSLSHEEFDAAIGGKQPKLPTIDDVKRAAVARGIDPDFAASIMGQESDGNWKTKDSPKGARGGMQVMPGTFKQMMGDDGNPDDPWDNMEAGLRYIDYGRKKLGTDDPKLLAAGYHQGYDRPELKRGVIADTTDGAKRTRDYANEIAARMGINSADGAAAPRELSANPSIRMLQEWETDGHTVSWSGGGDGAPVPAPVEGPKGNGKGGLDLMGAAKKGAAGLKVTWDYLANALERGVTGAEADTGAILEKSAAEYQRMASDPRIAELAKRGNDAPGWGEAAWEMTKYLVENPTVVANFLAEQVPGMVASLPAGGTGGAISGSVARGVAAKAGASAATKAAVGKAAGMAGFGASLNASQTALMSLGSNYSEGLEKFGGDVEKARDYATTKTLAEVPANAIAGAFMAVNPFKSIVANTALQATAQGLGGAVGAAQGAASVGETAGKGELLMEFGGEFLTAPADVAAEKIGRKKEPAPADTGAVPATDVLGTLAPESPETRPATPGAGSQAPIAPAPATAGDDTIAQAGGLLRTELDAQSPNAALTTPIAGDTLARVDAIDARLAAVADPQEAAALTQERARLTANWPAMVVGRAAPFATETGANLDAQFAIVDAGSLTASHDTNLRQNPAYPQELQPRDRERAASEVQISGIVAKLAPQRLGASGDAANGAPIVGADGLVESGNARTIALQRVYQANGAKAQSYRDWLIANADAFGFTSDQVAGIEKPVLVRVRLTPVNRAEFARQANAPTTAVMSTVEQARSDAAQIQNLDDLETDESGDFTGAVNRGFVRRFVGGLATTEQAGLVGADGQLSQSGYARIRNAVLARAYGDSPVLQRMVESLDNNLRGITGALMRVAPQVAKARDSIAAGAMFDRDITENLLGAVEELSRLRTEGRSVAEYLAQAGMFGDALAPETADLLAFLDANIRSPKRIAEFLQAYLDVLASAGNPNQDTLFGGGEAPAKQDIIDLAKERTKREQDRGAVPDGARGATGADAGGAANDDAGGAAGGARDDRTGTEGRARLSRKAGSEEGAGPDATPEPLEPGAVALPTEGLASGDDAALAETPEAPAQEFATQIIRALSQAGTLFQQPKSDKTTLTAIAADIDPGMKVSAMAVTSPRVERLVTVTMPDGAKAMVRIYKDGAVDLDASLLTEGSSRGTALYNLVATFAHNAGKLFIGDPNGLSDAALYRRTENMIASAAKFGTTEHLYPHERQIAEGLKWSDDPGADNLGNLLMFSRDLLAKAMPESADLVYNFETQQFEGVADGKPLTDADLKLLARDSRGAATARAGYATLKRAALLNTLVRGTGEADRGRILGQVVRQLREGLDPNLQRSFYSRKAQAAPPQQTDRPASPAKPTQAPPSAGLSVSGLRAGISKILAQAKRLPAGGVQVVQSVANLPEGLRDFLRSENAEAEVEGIYDPASKTVWLVADHLPTAERAEQVLFHELYGHFGLQGLFGKGLSAALRDLVARNKNLRVAAAKMRMEHGYDEDIANEEALVELAERGESLEGLRRFVAAMQKALRELGFERLADWMEGLTDAEAMTVIAEARRFVRGQAAGETQPTALDQAGAAGVMSRKAGPGNSRTARPGSSNIGKNQASSSIDQQADDILSKKRGRFTPLETLIRLAGGRGATAGERSRAATASISPTSWTVDEPSRLDNIIYSLQDKLVDTRRVLRAIKEWTGSVAEWMDPYLQEELYHGRAAKRVGEFANDELRPMLLEMQRRQVTVAEFEEFLHARHAEERNEQIAKVNPAMPDGGSGMTTANARAHLSAIPAAKRRDLDALAKRIDDITAETRAILIGYGLESANTMATWEGAYKHYVPLMREDMDHGFATNGTGAGFSVRGSASKRATGSTKAVTSIIGNLALQRERAIVRGEKNRVATALWGLAKMNPNPDFWKVDTPPKIKTVSAVTGLVEERPDPTYKGRDNVIVARIPDPQTGEVHERSIVFNERSERAMRMAAALKNLDADRLGLFLGISARITRYFAAINTQYNPVFGIVNLIRDVQGAMFNLTNTPLAGRQAEVSKNILAAMRGVYVQERSGRKGRHAGSPWSGLWEEFQKEGGQTGYRDMFATGEERAKALEKEIAALTHGKLRTGARAFFDWLSDYNSAIENSVRLAAYKTGIDAGLSKQKAASVAKNLTVNFNRKGQAATQVGAMYAFFNASVQGTARLAQTLAGPSGRKIMAGGVMLGAMQALALSMAGFDDDEPPQFIRERNLVIPVGGGRYVSIPMPLGLHVLPNIGRIVTEFALGGLSRPGERVVELLGVLAEAFNPIGSAGMSLQTITPTAVDPLAALAENRDWTGKPIYREDFNRLAPTPGFTRTKDTASSWAKGLAWVVNRVSGGTDFQRGLWSPTPDQFDYLIGQATGGVGREASKAWQTGASLYTGEELPTYKIPLVGRLIGTTDGQSSQANRFYSNLTAMAEHEAEIKGRARTGDDVKGYLEAHPEARLWAEANAAERQVSQLRKAKREMIEDGRPSEQVSAMDKRIALAMTRLNNRVKAVRAQRQ